MAIRYYWPMVAAAVGFRLVLVLFGGDLHLASRPEVSTPLTSLRRRKRLLTSPASSSPSRVCCVGIAVIRVPPLCVVVAEGYWLKQASMSPYSGT